MMTAAQCREDLASKGFADDEIEEIVTLRLAKGTIAPDASDEIDPAIAQFDAVAAAAKLAKAKRKDEDDGGFEYDSEADEVAMSGHDDDEDQNGNGSMDPEPGKHSMAKAQREAADLLKAEIRDVVDVAVKAHVGRLVEFVGERFVRLNKAHVALAAQVDAVSDLVEATGTLAKGANQAVAIAAIREGVEELRKAFKGPRGDFRGASTDMNDIEIVHPPGDAPPADNLNKGGVALFKAADRFLAEKRDHALSINDDAVIDRIAKAYNSFDPNIKLECAKSFGFTG